MRKKERKKGTQKLLLKVTAYLSNQNHVSTEHNFYLRDDLCKTTTTTIVRLVRLCMIDWTFTSKLTKSLATKIKIILFPPPHLGRRRRRRRRRRCLTLLLRRVIIPRCLTSVVYFVCLLRKTQR